MRRSIGYTVIYGMILHITLVNGWMYTFDLASWSDSRYERPLLNDVRQSRQLLMPQALRKIDVTRVGSYSKGMTLNGTAAPLHNA